MNGETIYPDETEEKIQLTESVRRNIRKSEPVGLFETFLCNKMKEYIIDACQENGFDLQLDNLNTFIGIIMISSFNNRKFQRDYCSSDPFISCEVASSAMRRDEFDQIKLKLKYSKSKDSDTNDKGWRVRALMKLF